MGKFPESWEDSRSGGLTIAICGTRESKISSPRSLAPAPGRFAAISCQRSAGGVRRRALGQFAGWPAASRIALRGLPTPVADPNWTRSGSAKSFPDASLLIQRSPPPGTSGPWILAWRKGPVQRKLPARWQRGRRQWPVVNRPLRLADPLDGAVEFRSAGNGERLLRVPYAIQLASEQLGKASPELGTLEVWGVGPGMLSLGGQFNYGRSVQKLYGVAKAMRSQFAAASKRNVRYLRRFELLMPPACPVVFHVPSYIRSAQR